MSKSKSGDRRVCARYSKADAETMKALRKVVKTALLEMASIQRRSLAKEGEKPPKGTYWDKVDLKTNSHEFTWDDGSVTCDDAEKGVCCSGGCPC
jgi:hypothetical protein